MSTDYSLVCLDCEEDLGWDGLTDPETPAAWLTDAEALARICEAIEKLKASELEVSLGFHGWVNRLDLRFFVEHRRHHLVVMD